MNIDEARALLNEFTLRHKVVFQDAGEVGFGRECVGIMHGDAYVDYNPRRYPNLASVFGDDARICAPDNVTAYHKHDCLAVLGRGDAAIIGLATWVRNFNALGVEIVPYGTGATGLQALLTGIVQRAIRVATNPNDNGYHGLVDFPRGSEYGNRTEQDSVTYFIRCADCRWHNRIPIPFALWEDVPMRALLPMLAAERGFRTHDGALAGPWVLGERVLCGVCAAKVEPAE